VQGPERFRRSRGRHGAPGGRRKGRERWQTVASDRCGGWRGGDPGGSGPGGLHLVRPHLELSPPAERAGYVQKLSRKGWLCKTWEGEMALVSMPGTWPRSSLLGARRHDRARINDTIGARRGLTYEQHIASPTTCFGETQYFVKPT